MIKITEDRPKKGRKQSKKQQSKKDARQGMTILHEYIRSQASFGLNICQLWLNPLSLLSHVFLPCWRGRAGSSAFSPIERAKVQTSLFSVCKGVLQSKESVTKEMAAVCCLVHASPFGQEINALGFHKNISNRMCGCYVDFNSFSHKEMVCKIIRLIVFFPC